MADGNEKFIILRNSVEQAAWIAQVVPGQNDSDTRTFHGHKFAVVFGGWKDALSKRGSQEETIGGKLNVSVGHVWRMADFSIKVKHTLYGYEDQNYGVKSDLESYFLLNNPNGTPSNVVYLVDHFGAKTLAKVGVAGVLMGDFIPSPLSVIISGVESYYVINIQYRTLLAVA